MFNKNEIEAYNRGYRMLNNGIVVRHLNGNCKDNSYGNICIGTDKDNKMDMPKNKVLELAINASKYVTKYSNLDVIKIKEYYKLTKSYKKKIATNLNLKQNIIMETNFKELKKEILKRAKNVDACALEYKRAYKSESFEELLQVIKDNFDFAVRRKVIDIELIKLYENEFNNNKIYGNIDISEGYLLVDNATVIASGNATVIASGNATVKASGNATVKAWDNATVEAWDNATVIASGNATVIASGNATVIASGNATVIASGNATVKAWDNATVEAWDNATVKASGNATVKASGNATVKASGNAYITSYYTIECILSDNSIYRIRESNAIKFASDEIKFEKYKATSTN